MSRKVGVVQNINNATKMPFHILVGRPQQKGFPISEGVPTVLTVSLVLTPVVLLAFEEADHLALQARFMFNSCRRAMSSDNSSFSLSQALKLRLPLACSIC